MSCAAVLLGLTLSLAWCGSAVGSVTGHVVSGNVASDGSVTSGAGFTVSHSTPGTYVVTFGSAISNVPAVTCSTTTSGNPVVCQARSETVNGFTAVLYDTSFNGANGSFSFIALDPAYSFPGGGSNTLAGLSDVNVGTVSDGKVLKYVGADGKWEPGVDQQGSGSFSTGDSQSLTDIRTGVLWACGIMLGMFAAMQLRGVIRNA